jgi:hypothetical protein
MYAQLLQSATMLAKRFSHSAELDGARSDTVPFVFFALCSLPLAVSFPCKVGLIRLSRVNGSVQLENCLHNRAVVNRRFQPPKRSLKLLGKRVPFTGSEGWTIEDEQCQKIGGGYKAVKFRFLLFL